ncbi:MAG: hypothetical protein U9N50_10095 [Pseudomonadota bacterium]|nr:hypothetical protein [Pseudomonadota bacterium]
MSLKTRSIFSAFILCVAFMLTGNAIAADDAALAAQANNPLANMTAFNLHNYYIGEQTGSGESANQFWLRYAKPFSLGGDWLMRASLPINTFPALPDGVKETGLGDLNVFAAYLFDTGNPAVSFGLGPQLNIPTATKDELGSEKWSAGLANVLFDARSATFQYGYLLTWMASFAGEDDRADVNTGAFQPFAMYQLGKGSYLRSTGIWVYDFETDNYTIPLGIGFGKVFKNGKTVYNAFVEPQWSVADEGPGWSEWQVFVGFNMQFLK